MLPQMLSSLFWLIDDDEHERALIQQILSEHAPNVTLIAYSSAAQALTLLRNPETIPPQLILLDLQMPVVTGLELLGLLKADPLFRQIPIVILSASEDPHQIQEADVRYASSYVNKGRTFEDLQRQLLALLQFWRIVTPPPLRS